MRKILVAGNWKMNASSAMVEELLDGLLEGTRDGRNVDMAVFPPFPYIAQARSMLDGSVIAWGGQNLNPAEKGAHTGEVSASMLLDFGCRYVLVGHSERRTLYGESDQDVAERFAAALAAGLHPVLCIGETLQEREAGQTEAVVARQIDAVLAKSGIAAFAQATVAYEPVWAIGTGKTATPEQAQAVHKFIRDKFADLDAIIAGQLRILYGGSVNGSNAADLFAREDIDGGLVGGASLKADDFLAIIRAAAEYDAAAALINLQAWGRASTVLEEFRRDYPDSQFADDVSQKLAVAYLESGRSGQAAGEFERIAQAPSSSEEVRREALWRAAELYEETGSQAAEKRVLEDIVARFPNPIVESIEARARLLDIAKESGNEQERIARLEDLVRVDATAGAQRSDRTRFLAAKASLELAEPVRRKYEVVKLTQPLADSLKLKKDLMEDVITAYTDAADYGVAEVTTAATYRLGEVYEQFSIDLMGSDRPADLAADALEQYEILLEEQAFPFEEKAIDLYVANADRAPDGVYDDWVRKSFERLARLMPARYAKEERSEDVITAPY